MTPEQRKRLEEFSTPPGTPIGEAIHAALAEVDRLKKESISYAQDMSAELGKLVQENSDQAERIRDAREALAAIEELTRNPKDRKLGNVLLMIRVLARAALNPAATPSPVEGPK